MPKWNLAQAPQQAGKIAIVTGANSGIGYETALGLAKKQAEVILACRNLDKALEAQQRILKDCPTAQLEIMQLDASSLQQVEKFTQRFKEKYDKLDLLINNAGIMMSPYEMTEEGFENQFATNYLGHFALTGHLLPFLAEKARVVSLTSLSYKWSEIQFDNFNAEKGYSKRKAYGQSKRACLMFAYELQRRLDTTRHTALSMAAHPGLSNTNLDRYFPALIRPLGALFLQSARKGALPVLYAALSEQVEGGEFIGPDGFREMRGYPTEVDSDAYSKNIAIAERLWQASERMTGLSYLHGAPSKSTE